MEDAFSTMCTSFADGGAEGVGKSVMADTEVSAFGGNMSQMGLWGQTDHRLYWKGFFSELLEPRESPVGVRGHLFAHGQS